MTLQQLRYAVTVAETGTITEAANKLYISQPSLTNAIFAMARGYQGDSGDVKALAMKKWFNTNYHYIVPEIEDDTKIELSGNKLWEEYEEAKKHGHEDRIWSDGDSSLKAGNTKTNCYILVVEKKYHLRNL